MEIKRWVKKFGNRGMESASVTDVVRQPHLGFRKATGQTTSVTDANSGWAYELIRRGRRVMVQNIADAMNISYESAQGISADFGYYKIWAKGVPKQLSLDNWRKRAELCQEALNVFEMDQQEEWGL